jgi:alpha-D-xyloside xylohydrolase
VQGDWHFDPEYWPDPTAMVLELKNLGMEVMVTVWPFSFNGSQSFDTLNSSGWLVQSISDAPAPVYENDALHGGLVDVTQSAAREYA